MTETIDVPLGGFNKLIGLHLDHVDLDRVEAHLEVTGDHHQPYGLVHGGVYAAMVETLASTGAAVWAISKGIAGVVGVSNGTDFLRSTREGVLRAIATPIHRGRTQQVWQVEVTRDDGKVAARGQVRLQNIPDPDVIGGLGASQTAAGASTQRRRVV